MVKLLTIVIVMLAVVLTALGQAKTSAASDESEAAISRFEQQFATALTTGDGAFLEKQLTDSFIFRTPFGKLLTKAQVINDVSTGSLQMKSVEIVDLKITANGNSAIATYRTRNVGLYKFVEISGQYQWIDVFENSNGRWQLIYQQGTSVAEPK